MGKSVLERDCLGSGLITRRKRWRPGGWQNDVGAAVIAGCNGPPVLLSGKERLDFVTPTLQLLAVMDWFLAAATGRDARGDILLDQHLTDFVPVIPLTPHHRGPRWQSLRNTSAPVKSLQCPSRRWSRRGPPLLSQTIRSLLLMPPLLPPIRRGHPLFVEAGRRGMGFEVSGVKHQHLWLWGIG